LRPAKPGDAFGGRVPIDTRLGRGFDELVDHVFGGRQIRIAHAEVDDVGTGVAGGGLEAVDLFENVRRQPLDTVEFEHGPKTRWEKKTLESIFSLNAIASRSYRNENAPVFGLEHIGNSR
jgi:hypothetical protein